MKLLSIGQNRKLAKGVGIFNLPQGFTCPGKTPLCKQLCYALKAERMYKAARVKRASNLQASYGNAFPGLLAAEIKANKLSLVRFHESGDAYDQGYLDKLLLVCSLCPATQFLMYTKSFHLDFSGRPSNLSLYYSVDKTTPTPAPGSPTAYLVSKGEAPPPGAVTCVHTKDRHYCGSECTTCWDGKADVYFDQH